MLIDVKVEEILNGGKKTSSGNFLVKLVSEKTVKVLGIEKVAKLTYYIALPAAPKVGLTDKIELDKFNIVERPYERVDDKTGEVTTFLLKWLHVK